MLTRKRWVPPIVPPGLDADVDKYLRVLNKSISDYLLSLETPESLTINEAEITATNGIIFPSGTIADYKEYSTTPTPTAGSGSFTSVSAAVDGALINGNFFVFDCLVTVTTNGTAGTYIKVALPVTPARQSGIGGICSTGAIAGYAGTDGLLYIYKYDLTYPGVSGTTIAVSGVFLV